MTAPTPAYAPALRAGSDLGDQLELFAGGPHAHHGQRAAVRLLRATTLIERAALVEHLSLTAEDPELHALPSSRDYRLVIDWDGIGQDPRLSPTNRADTLLVQAAASLDQDRTVDTAELATLPPRLRARALAALACALDATEHAEVRAAYNPEFDFFRDVIGDDLVIGGVVYSSAEWTMEDGEARELTEQERTKLFLDRLAEDAGSLARGLDGWNSRENLDPGNLLSVLDPLLRLLDQLPTAEPTVDYVHRGLAKLGWSADGDGLYTHSERSGWITASVTDVAAAYAVGSALAARALATGRPSLIEEQSARNAAVEAWRDQLAFGGEPPF